MIKEEMLTPQIVRHYSDAGMKIRQIETGNIYDDAADIIPCRYTYEETEEPIEETEATADEVVAILTGEAE